jgi:DNA primase
MVLFRLPEITQQIREGLPVFVCEGEKDILALVKHGFSATCNPMGAKKWRDSYSETLRGADVIIIADKDQVSYKMEIIKEGNATVKVYVCSCVSIALPASL